MAKVSILIAAYNVEKYISEAIRSALNQTLKDIEIIVVDDASTDNTKKEIAQFDGIDDRLKTIYLAKNQGTLMVRKIAVSEAGGEYIMFLDGDDTLNPYACEKAYNAIVKEKVDILQFDINVFTVNDDIYGHAVEGLHQYLNLIERKIVSNDKNGLLNKKITGVEFGTSPVNKIYKRDVLVKTIRELPREHIILAEDMLMSYIMLFFAKSYSFIPDKLYNYRFGVGISTKIGVSRKKIECMAKMWYIYKFLNKWFTENSDIEVTGWVVEKFKTEAINVIGNNFLNNCRKKDQQYFEDCLLKYCSVEEYIYIMLYAVYINKAVRDDELAYICANQKRFDYPAKEVKTIGTFYYRMYNGGIENVISSITDIWVKSGYNVVLFTDEEANEKDYYINPQVKRVVLPKHDITDINTCKNRIDKWSDTIKQYDIDTVVYHAWANTYMITDLLSVKAAGCSLIMHTHGPFCIGEVNGNQYDSYMDILRTDMYKLADVILTLGSIDQTYWKSHGFKSIKVINPVQLSIENKKKLTYGNNILFVGRISPEKQVLDAIKAVEIARQSVPDIKLTILGKAENKDYFEGIEKYVKSNDLENTVEFAGFHLDVRSYYENADVMLCTSIIEGQSIAMIESKVCGVPLISYEMANMDMIRESKGMFVVPQGDYVEMADKIVRILKDNSLRDEMSEQARKSAEDMYNIDLAQQWHDIFKRLMQPSEKNLPIYKRPELDAAIALREQFRKIGMKKQSVANNRELRYYMLQCNALNATIEEIRSSTSYRLGAFITSLPRKIKNILKR